MGVKIAIGSVVYVLVVLGLSLCFWEFLHMHSEIIRNIALAGGAPLAIFLAVWRSRIAEKQAGVAQRALLSDRHQRAVEMLESTISSIRIGGIHALKNLASEHPEEYLREVRVLLEVYSKNLPEDLTNKMERDVLEEVLRQLRDK